MGLGIWKNPELWRLWRYNNSNFWLQIQNKPNLRVKRAWVETPGAWFSFFVSGPPFTPYQEFLPNFECLYRIQRPRKPPKTCFCDLKRSNNAIIVKIVVSKVDFRVLQTNDWTNRAMQQDLKTRVLNPSSMKISVQSVRYLALHLSTTRRTTTTTTTTTTRKKMKQTCLPIWILKPLPGFQKLCRSNYVTEHVPIMKVRF